MKKLYILLFTLLISAVSFGQDLIITGAYDGPLSGGTPKGVELYVVNNIADLSIYGIGSANNGGGTDGEEFTFPADAVTAGTYLYVSSEAVNFQAFFGFAPDYNAGSAMGINGDDAIELFMNGSVIDVFGDINTDGSGQPWDYLDGWAYRVDGTGPDGSTFVLANWSFSGINVFDGETTNGTATTPFPNGTYSTTPSSTPTISVGSAVSGLDYFEGNGPSNEGTFTVSGINLTADITVTAPTDFEVSLTSGSGFGASVIVTQSGGTAASTTVYARLVAGLTSNPYSGDVTASSTGATDKTVNLSGTVSPAVPQITISGFVGDLNYTEGSGPSAEDSFTVEGLFLTTDITVSAPTNFEVSLVSGSGFGTSVMVAQAGGTVPTTTVYVRLASGLTTNDYSGDVTASSTGATDQLLAITGNVFPIPTCSNVGDIIITEVMQNPNAVGDSVGEWFEVYNTTGAPIDMLGWTIKDDTSVSETYTIPTSVVVPANGYVVFGNNANSATNGSVTVNHQYDTISLGNSTDGLIIECSSTTIDSVIWDNGATFPDPTGASMELSTTTLNSVANDTGSNWAPAVSALSSGDLGTPGAVNDFTLGIDDFKTNNFKIYPNPTSKGFVNISSNNGAAMKVTVFDVLGKQVINEMVSDKRLDVSNLNAGIYIMKVTQDNASVTKKLVIK
jgi:Lamin Tail Domain/Secretion system C-terminal sorting domain